MGLLPAGVSGHRKPNSPEKYLYHGWDLVRWKTPPNSYISLISNMTHLIKDKLNLNHGIMITKDVKITTIICRGTILVHIHHNVYDEDLASSS